MEKYFKELDKLVILRSEYLTSSADFYKEEVRQINKRISELHNLIYKLKQNDKRRANKKRS